MAKKIAGVEYKSFGLKLDNPPDEEGRFTGYAAVFGNVDRDGDVIEPGAFTKSLQERPEVPILWQHNTDEPIGVSVSMTEDTKGLRVEGQLALDVQRAAEVRSLMQMGALKGLSIRYGVVKRAFANGVRHLKELKLTEWSPVVFGANELATVESVKARKWFGPYGLDDDTEGVDCLLSMIASGADFMAEEAEEGDTADVARMQSILSSLTKILASELAEVAQGDDSEDVEQDVIYVEMMSAVTEGAIKSLEALRKVPEPGSTTTQPEGAASTEDVEPVGVSTLRGLMGDMHSFASTDA